MATPAGKGTTTTTTTTTSPIVVGNTAYGQILKNYLSGTNGVTGAIGMFGYNPKTSNQVSYTQTGPQDIESAINATFQQMAGRNATPQEIAKYGAEILAAEKANVSLYHQVLSYDPGTGKAITAQGTNVSSGLDIGSFLQNLISGNADVQSYKMATGYMDAMTQALQQMKSE